MSIVAKAKYKNYILDVNQAVVMLDDGIWRHIRGVYSKGWNENFFTFIYEGEIITVDSGSFKRLRDDTSDEEAYEYVCKMNTNEISSFAMKKALNQAVREATERRAREEDLRTPVDNSMWSMNDVRFVAYRNAREALEAAFAGRILTTNNNRNT